MPFTSPLLFAVTDTLNDKVDAGALHDAIDKAGLTSTLDFVNVNPAADRIELHFVDTSTKAISDADHALAASEVSDHDGESLAIAANDKRARVSHVGSDQTTSSSPVAVPNVQFTVGTDIPPGKWAFSFISAVRIANVLGSETASLFIAKNGAAIGVTVAYTNEALGQQSVPIALEGEDDVVDGDVIDVKWSTTGSTAHISDRSLIAERVG